MCGAVVESAAKEARRSQRHANICRTRAHLGVPQGTQAAEDREVESVCKARGNTECEPGDGLAGLAGIDAAGAEPVRLATAWLAS